MGPKTEIQPDLGDTLVETKPRPMILEDQVVVPNLPGANPNEKLGSSFVVPEEPQSNNSVLPPAWLHEPVQSTFNAVELADPLAIVTETAASKEMASKTNKLGKLASRASIQVVKVLDKFITRMGAVSVLYPGSAMLHADTGGEVESLPEPVMTGETAMLFESQGYIKNAPNFNEQMRDTTRTNTFKYINARERIHTKSASAHEIVEMTEHAGLVELYKFLKSYVEFAGNEKKYSSRKEKAESMLERLTFIGQKEYAEAAKGLGEYWKAYLDADPKRQICITTNISKNKHARKSDSFLSETIISGFSDEEIERYSGRIVTEVDDIKSAPDDVKIVLLDDWTISGSQMSVAYNTLVQADGYQRYAASVEINLIAASSSRIKDGLEISNWDWDEDTVVPVRAYYLAHEAKADTDYEPTHITGTHSSVDFDFETDIHYMVTEMDLGRGSKKPEDKRLTMPPLTNIVRTYYGSTPKVRVQRGGAIVRTHSR